MSAAAVKALKELVRLKKIKERIEELEGHGMWPGSKEDKEWKRLINQYDKAKEKAWDAAKAAVK